MTDPEALLTELRGCSPDVAVDRAAEALAESGEAISALAERSGYDTATLWSAAGALAEAYAAILPYTSNDLPDPPPGPGALAADLGQLIEVLHATAEVLDRAARAAAEPDHIHALARGADLTERGRRGCANAMAAA